MSSREFTRDSERREATVFYADISGFTALSEKLDPEDVTAVMNRVFEILEGIVMTHGGAVDKYIGDCVMAVFGFTLGIEEPATQAVRAALEIRSALYRFNREAEVPTKLDIHIGINTGAVLAGMIGGEVRRDFTVTGDTVNFAARLEDASDKGQIFVGPTTRAQTDAYFEYVPVDPIELREDTEPIAVYELLGVKQRPRHVKRDSERRQATVLFAALHGFEQLAGQVSPEEHTQLLNHCFAIMESAVHGYGGVVDKYIGECIMALFGIPNAIENAPQQAINAAIDMRNRLASFNQEEHPAVHIGVHMGINTGLVIAGDIGGRIKRDFTAMGHTVNLASRLKDAAPMGAIFIAPETYRYTHHAFEFGPSVRMNFKGNEQPVAVYELASVKEQVHRVTAARSGLMVFSEIVGREREIAQLLACLDRLLAGEGGIVSVIGEAGLGKSRLMAEVLSRAEWKSATVLEGRSTAIGQNLSFRPFVDLLQQWAGITDEDLDPQSLAKLGRAIAAVLPDEADDVTPFIATLMGLRLDGAQAARVEGIDGEAMEKLIFSSMRQLVQAVARARPLVLICEDLHWADQSSVNLLEALLRLVTDNPLLIVNVFRPDCPETAEHILRVALETVRARHTAVRIEPLDEQESSLLVQQLLKIDDLPPNVRDLITNKAEGNPFYIEEVVRSLIDRGAVELRDGRFCVTEKIETAVIPGTVQEVIMSRVDRLHEPTRHLLQVASVVGRDFYFKIIADIVRRQGESDEDLPAHFEVLKEKQLLLERRGRGGWAVSVGDRGVGEELEYIFKHALAQQTIYESLLQKTRRQFHAIVAQSIESMFAERLNDFYGMLAHHHARAENLVKAEDYLFKAGEEATRSAASREALKFFQEAVRIYEKLHGDGGDPRRRAALEKNIGLALLNTGKLTDSIGHFDGALALLRYGESSTALGTWLQFLRDFAAVLFHLYFRSDRMRTLTASETERECFQIVGSRTKALSTSDPKRLFFGMFGGIRRLNRIDPRTIEDATAFYVMASGLFSYSGTSFAIARRFVEVAKKSVHSGNLKDEVASRTAEFLIAYLEGQWDDRYTLGDALLQQAVRQGLLWDVQTYLGLDCDRRLRRGDFAGADSNLAHLAQIIDSYGFEFAQSNHDGMTAVLLVEQRKLAAALAAVEHYHAGLKEDTLRVFALGTKAKIQVLIGDRVSAATALHEAEEIIRRAGFVPPWHRSAYAVGRLQYDVAALEDGIRRSDGADRRGLIRRARSSSRHALRVVGAVAAHRTEAYRLSGLLHWLVGERRRAQRLWTRGIAEGRRLGALPELARLRAEIHRCELADGGAAGLEGNHLQEAGDLFTQLGLTWDLDQLRLLRQRAA